MYNNIAVPLVRNVVGMVIRKSETVKHKLRKYLVYFLQLLYISRTHLLHSVYSLYLLCYFTFVPSLFFNIVIFELPKDSYITKSRIAPQARINRKFNFKSDEFIRPMKYMTDLYGVKQYIGTFYTSRIIEIQ